MLAVLDVLRSRVREAVHLDVKGDLVSVRLPVGDEGDVLAGHVELCVSLVGRFAELPAPEGVAVAGQNHVGDGVEFAIEVVAARCGYITSAAVCIVAHGVEREYAVEVVCVAILFAAVDEVVARLCGLELACPLDLVNGSEVCILRRVAVEFFLLFVAGIFVQCFQKLRSNLLVLLGFFTIFNDVAAFKVRNRSKRCIRLQNTERVPAVFVAVLRQT